MRNVKAGFGVVGNFAEHLEQAGEAADFARVATPAGTPKGLFPFYVNGAEGYLGRPCVDNSNLIIPKGANVQAEPEIAVRFGVNYYGGQVYELEAQAFMAFNDASVRGDKTAVKISQKKNFSTASKGAGGEIAIDFFERGGICDRFSLVSFLRSGDEWLQYGECARLSDYSYFYGELVGWIIDRLNSQPDFETLENLSSHLATAGFPGEILITLGATRYEKGGLERYLKAGDEIQIITFNHEKFSLADIEKAARESSLKNGENISVLTQKVSEL